MFFRSNILALHYAVQNVICFVCFEYHRAYLTYAINCFY